MIIRLLLAFVAFAASAAVANAERRAALVIGNSNYSNAVKLPNPQMDAEAIATMLRGSFDTVILGTDLSRDGMIEKIGQFADAARVADTALFFYAGHGIQVDGKNYLVPVDADLKTELHAKNRTIDIDTVLQDAMSEAKRKLVLLDACRDNPFAKQIQATLPRTRSTAVSSGLAEMRSGEGTLIAFATGPGQVALDGEGRHSPFTRALLAHLPAPGVEIQAAMTMVRAQVQEETGKKQLPWANTNMVGFFYMQPGAAPAVPQSSITTAAVQPSFDARQLEMEMWTSVKTSTNPSEYEAYLKAYPNGTFADLARARITALGAGLQRSAPAASGEIKTAEASQSTEDALGLDRARWIDIQRRLSGLGFSTRGIDGSIGPGTRRGLEAWQAARGYPSSGYLNRLQHEALLREAVPAGAAAAQDTRGYAPTQNTGTVRNSGGATPGQMGEFLGGVAKGLVKPGGIRLPGF
ncbi:MAG: caspase family protein [Hyphomicrobiaceae bacterium]|nr:caspase family protein [Hyphomicrobiaceae bacterium]